MTNQTKSKDNKQVQKTIREKSEDANYFESILVNTLDPSLDDVVTIEKVATMVNIEISSAVFFQILDTVKRKKPKKPVGYFFAALRAHVPTIYQDMNAIFVAPSR